jgi:hypothetical protein
MVPEQLSIAVGGTRLVTSHADVTSDNDCALGTGAITSLITTDWVWEVVFPEPSVKDHVTLVDWVIGNTVEVVPVIKPEQLSVAVGGVIEAKEHDSFIVAN